jgi:AcrR family transcriptional regulator
LPFLGKHLFSKIRLIQPLSRGIWKINMVRNAELDRRGPGRPSVRPDDETLRLIIQAATQAFREGGYAGTGIAAVAQRAGVSTKTLYRLVPTKADLFKSVISDRTGRFMLAVDEPDGGQLDLVAGLERILIAYASLILDPEVIAVYKLVLGECGRFPEIAQAYYEGAVQRTGEAMAGWLDRQRERGLIAFDDPHTVAGMLRGMMVMEPQRAAMLGQSPAPDAAAIAERAKLCAALFLKGCLVAP